MTQKHVVITGASTGIGRAAALRLAQNGFHVFAGVRKTAAAESLQEAAQGNPLTPIMLDVTQPDQIAAAAQEIGATVGEAGLAGLVNNAGLVVASPLEFILLDELRYQIEVNVIGQVAVTQALLPCLRPAKGRIVNISSIAGRITIPAMAAYNASKHALETVSDGLRMELKPWGIEVICIEPGSIKTNIWDTGVTRANSTRQKLPAQAEEMYGTLLNKAERSARRSEQQGIPAERVAIIIERALTVPRPKTRYLVGTDARIAALLKALLPDRWFDGVIMSQVR